MVRVDGTLIPDLDGDLNVVLAPVGGRDHRRQLPEIVFERRPARFLAKFFFAVSLLVACYLLIALRTGWLASILGIVVLGLMYAHLVELQHECLHRHAFQSRRLNRLFGILAGLFMLSSYSHYRYKHLRHHAYLGTSQNEEFFNYRFQHLSSVWGFCYAALHPARYAEVL